MKLLLAPMATVSHEAFRRAVARFGGCDEYYNEMINAPSLLAGGQWEKYYLLAETEPEKLVWQLTGNKAEPMAEAAALLAERDGIGIDLNMGCSAPQIANTGAGVAWMTKPLTETAALVRLVKAALANAAKDGRTEKRLSVKLRLGADDFTDAGFFAFTDMLVAEGVQQLTLHPRTKKEKYRAKPRWEYVERLALRYEGRVPVVLNGDVTDRASFAAAVRAAPHAAGVMIARAAAQKPWIFAEIAKAICADECGAAKLVRGAAVQESAGSGSGQMLTQQQTAADGETPAANVHASIAHGAAVQESAGGGSGQMLTQRQTAADSATPAANAAASTAHTASIAGNGAIQPTVATATPCASFDKPSAREQSPATAAVAPAAPLVIDCQQLALDFIGDVARFQPPEFYKTRLQRFFAYYCDNFSFAHYFKTQMLNAAAHAATPADAIDACKAAVCAYFAQCPEDCLRQLL